MNQATIWVTAGALAVLLIEVGLSLVQVDVWKNTESLYSHSVSVDPTNARSWNQLANIAAERGDLDAAWQITESGLAYSPTHWRLLHRKALLLEKAGRLDEAISWMRKAAEQPGADTACSNLALLLMRQGKLEEAQTWAERAVKSDPRDAHHRRALGVVLLARAQPGAAAREFERALEAEPLSGDNHMNLGLARLALGDRSGADRAFAAAVRVNPSLRQSIEASKARRARLTP